MNDLNILNMMENLSFLKTRSIFISRRELKLWARKKRKRNDSDYGREKKKLIFLVMLVLFR